MAVGRRFNYLVISDLHLQEADRDPAGRVFYFDHEFADFLRHYRLFNVDDRKWKLIIAGDLIEFYRIPVRPSVDEKLLRAVSLTPTDQKFFPGTEPEKSVWKLELILRSHPQLLLALARFVAEGNEIHIVRGNHDLEFYWPDVQERFRLLIAQHHPMDVGYLDMKAAVQDRIVFEPWFFLEKGLLYVEHGHQYDEYCSNAHPLHPVLAHHANRIELALSAFTMRYFVSRLKSVDPAAMENINSIPRYLLRLVRSNPGQALLMPVYYVEMLARTLAKVLPADAAQDAGLEAMEDQTRKALAGAHGLEVATLRKLESFARTPILASRWQTIKCFSLDLMGVGLVGVAGLGWLFSTTLVAGRGWAGLVAVLFAALLALVGRRRMSRVNNHGNLREIARAIQATVGVRHVVFGHSHDPDAVPLSFSNEWYFNIGTWVPRGAEGQFTYLELRDSEGAVAYLMRWDRRLGHPVPMEAIARS